MAGRARKGRSAEIPLTLHPPLLHPIRTASPPTVEIAMAIFYIATSDGKKKHSDELRKAIKRQMRQKREAKEMLEKGDRKRKYHSGLDQWENKGQSEVDREAYNLTRIHSADPMAQFFEEKEQKKLAKKAKKERRD